MDLIHLIILDETKKIESFCWLLIVIYTGLLEEFIGMTRSRPYSVWIIHDSNSNTFLEFTVVPTEKILSSQMCAFETEQNKTELINYIESTVVRSYKL